MTVDIRPHPLWPLRQHLKRVLRCERHDGKYFVDKFVRHEVGKQVRHAAHEDHPWLAPAQRCCQHLFVEEQLDADAQFTRLVNHRSEEHTSELQSLMRISYAVFCLTKKTIKPTIRKEHH